MVVAAAAAVSLPQGVQVDPVFTHAETEAAEAADPADFEPPSSPSSNAPKVCAGAARLIASAPLEARRLPDSSGGDEVSSHNACNSKQVSQFRILQPARMHQKKSAWTADLNNEPSHMQPDSHAVRAESHGQGHAVVTC